MWYLVFVIAGTVPFFVKRSPFRRWFSTPSRSGSGSGWLTIWWFVNPCIPLHKFTVQTRLPVNHLTNQLIAAESTCDRRDGDRLQARRYRHQHSRGADLWPSSCPACQAAAGGSEGLREQEAENPGKATLCSLAEWVTQRQCRIIPSRCSTGSR